MRTLDAFLEALRPVGCTYHEVPGKQGPHGPPSRCEILRKDRDGRLWVAQIPRMRDGDPLHPNTARSILLRLGLDPADVGY